MIRFKNRNKGLSAIAVWQRLKVLPCPAKPEAKAGFSFIEVVLAITIAGLLLTSLFTLQNTMFTNVIDSHFKIARIFLVKNFLFDTDNLEKFKKSLTSKIKLEPISKKIDDPQMTLKYDLKNINEKSSLKKFKNIYIIKSTGNWQSIRGQQEESFINLVYLKPEKKEKSE